MYEFLAHPITLLCLGTIFILVALLFFYFKRTFCFTRTCPNGTS